MKIKFFNKNKLLAVIFMLIITGVYPTTAQAQTAGTPQVAWTAAMLQGVALTGSNFTCRMITRPTIPGDTIRIHLSNFFGDNPVTFNAATVALRTSGAAVSNIATVRFGGQTSVTIPAHGQVVSDPITYTVNGQQDLAVNLYYAGANPTVTSKPSSRTTSYCSSLTGSAGNLTSSTTGTAFTNSGTYVYWVSAVDVYQSMPRGAIVSIGSSTTEGLKATIDQNKRWQDVVSTYLLGSSNPKSIVVEGISGDTVCSGNALNGGVARINREALAQANVSEVFLSHFGGNDLNNGATGDAVIACYQNIINQVRSAGLKIVGGTLFPRSFAAGSTQETYRQQVNTWIKTPGNFDAFIDIDAAVRDPSNPNNILPAYNSGDNVHLNDAGHNAEGQAVISAIGVFNRNGGDSARGVGPGTYDDMDYWPFVYAGSWNHDVNCVPNCYKNTKSWNATRTGNDSVTVTFNGTQIQLYGIKDDHFGIGAVSIDGGTETNIDFYASVRVANQLMWTSPVLPNGTHTFKLRSTGTKNVSSTDVWVEPDAVVVGGPGIFDDMNYSMFSYSGSWNHDASCVPNCYNGTKSWNGTRTGNDSVTVTFSGTQIQFYGIKDDHFGIGAVSIDGGAETNIDFYASVRVANQLMWTSPVLPNGMHTFKLRSTGTKNVSSTDVWVEPDAVAVNAGVFDDMNYSVFSYSGSWNHDASCVPNCYNGTKSWNGTRTGTDSVTVTFNGTQIQLYGIKDDHFGIGAVSIDGGTETNIDFYTSVRVANQLMWTSPVLPNGTHTFKLRSTGTKNTSSTDVWVEPDAVVVIP